MGVMTKTPSSPDSPTPATGPGAPAAPDAAASSPNPDPTPTPAADSPRRTSPSGRGGTPDTATPRVRGSVAGATWVGLIIGALLLILLLVFILQNQDSVAVHFLAWTWTFPVGVGMLIAAVAGALIMACVGVVRMLQLRRQVAETHRG
ncbi:lipopolysaccharide assembly protein LapA domain-containing protein [Corynebacterium bovis]